MLNDPTPPSLDERRRRLQEQAWAEGIEPFPTDNLLPMVEEELTRVGYRPQNGNRFTPSMILHRLSRKIPEIVDQLMKEEGQK